MNNSLELIDQSQLIGTLDRSSTDVRPSPVNRRSRGRRATATFEEPSPTAAPSRLQPTPGGILQLGLGFWGARTLLSAVELGLFTELASGPLTLREITNRLGLHRRAARDFLDALVALKMLEREGGKYRNTFETAMFLDRNQPSYVGGLLEMAATRLYSHWGNLTDSLRTGQPQSEIQGGKDAFKSFYEDPQRMRLFAEAMTGISLGTARALAARFPWADYRTFVDIGCAQGCVPVQLALEHSHLTGGGFDLPTIRPVFEAYVDSYALGNRLKFQPGDMFSSEPLPAADVLIFGHILHDWDLKAKRQLLAKAYESLNPGGAVIVYESLIDDERRQNAFGLLMSLNMLIETEGGFDYTGADCTAWMREAGFRDTRVEHLVGPDSMVVGIK